MRMKPLFIFTIIAVFAIAAAQLSSQSPARPSDFPVGSMVDTAKLYTPKSWKKGGRNWPVFLYYHGTGGRPSLDLAKKYAGDDAFFLVGMGYSIRGQIQAADHERFHDTEAANLIAVRDALAKHGGRANRIYVGGFSKGGWMASHFADRKPELIAGAAILGAGATPSVSKTYPSIPTSSRSTSAWAPPS